MNEPLLAIAECIEAEGKAIKDAIKTLQDKELKDYFASARSLVNSHFDKLMEVHSK